MKKYQLRKANNHEVVAESDVPFTSDVIAQKMKEAGTVLEIVSIDVTPIGPMLHSNIRYADRQRKEKTPC